MWLKKVLNFIKQYAQVVIWGSVLVSVGIFDNPQRRLLSNVHKILYRYYNPPIQTKLTQVPLNEICGNEQAVIVTQPTYVQGNTTSYEQLVLNNLAKFFSPFKIFEIGTFDGRTTLGLAINSPETVQIYTLDLPKNETSKASLVVSAGDQKLIETNVTGRRFLTEHAKHLLGTRKINQLLGDSATFDFTPYYDSCDLVFVDGAHTYEYVKNDSEIALKLLRGGKGIILWHDYDDKHPGSVKAIEELQSTRPDLTMFHIKDTNIAICISKMK